MLARPAVGSSLLCKRSLGIWPSALQPAAGAFAGRGWAGTQELTVLKGREAGMKNPFGSCWGSGWPQGSRDRDARAVRRLFLLSQAAQPQRQEGSRIHPSHEELVMEVIFMSAERH